MSALRPRRIVALDEQRFITCSQEAYIVYEARRRGDDVQTISEALSQYCGRPVTPVDVERMVAVLTANVALAAAAKRKSVRVLRKTLFSEGFVNAVAARLTWLFHPTLAACVLGLTIAATFVSFAGSSINRPTLRDWLLANLLFLTTIVAHELGHATACRSAGERPGPIGVTMFFMLPALYTDVSKAWLLNRRQRLAVDAGGVYFQLPFLALIAIGRIVTHDGLLFLAELMILTGIALNLNPVLRLDGYWLLADALDLPNLSKEPLRLLGAIRRHAIPLPGRARWQVAVVACYGVLNAAAWTCATAGSAYIIARRPAELSATWRFVNGNVTHLSPGVAIQIGVTLTSLVLLTYGLTLVIRRVLAFAAAFTQGVQRS